MDELQYLEPGEDDRTRGEYFSENGFGNGHFSESDWGDVQNEQYAREQSANTEMFDGFGQIVTRNRDAEAKMYGDRAVAGAAMIDNASKNPNGMSDRFLGQSLTNVFGQPILGAQILRGLQGDDAKYNGYVAIKGLVKDANGNETVGDVALMSPVAQLKMFQQAKIGDRAMEYRQQLYDGLAKQYTRDQLIAGGIQNPSGAYVVGSHSVPTLTRRRSSISAFGANGNGGFTNYYSGADTGYQLTFQDKGTRADSNNEWSMISVGPSDSADGINDRSQVRKYVNNRTGEVRMIKDGERFNASDSAAGYRNSKNASSSRATPVGVSNGIVDKDSIASRKQRLDELKEIYKVLPRKTDEYGNDVGIDWGSDQGKKYADELNRMLIGDTERGKDQNNAQSRPSTKGMSIIGDTLRYQDDTGNVVNVNPGGKVNIGGQDWYWDGGDGFLTAQEQAKKVLADRAANGGGATTPKTAPVTAAPSATPAAADKRPKVISPVTAGATASPSAPKPAAKTSGKMESQKLREKNGGAMPAEKEQTGTIYSPRVVNDEAGARIEVDATPAYGQRQPMFGGGSSIDAIRKYKQGEYEKSMQEKTRAAKADELNKWIDSELGDAERVNANAQVEHNLRNNPRMSMADLKRQDAEAIASEKARYAAERSDIVDRFLSNEENRRKAIARIANEKKRTDMKNKSLKEREAYARRLLSIYSSGDEDRIRKSMQDEADMYGLIEEIIGK